MPADDSTPAVAPSPTANPSMGLAAPKVLTKKWPSTVLVVACFTIASAIYAVHCMSGTDKPSDAIPKEGSIRFSETGLNANLFTHWPKGEKPEFVLVISAEMNGYLQKCGCSDPQKGGLERRWNLIEWLKNERGYDVLPLDLGDITTSLRQNPDPNVPTLHDQILLKYVTTMQILKSMGYKAIGVGLEEFSLPLEKAIAAYSMQDGNDFPRLLAANITGYQEPGKKFLERDVIFPNSQGSGSAIRDWEVFPVAGMNVGVVGLVGDPIARQVLGDEIVDAAGKPVLDANKNPLQPLKIDPSMRFAPDYGKAVPGPNSVKLVEKNLTDMSKLRQIPDLNVMLYQGPEDFARAVAGHFKAKPKHFDVIVCRTQESEPPGRPDQNVMIGNKTLLVEVGHKGQQIGVIGVFKKKGGGLDLHYQRIVLTEEFDTEKGKEGKNKALVELEKYSKTVKQNDYLAKYPKRPHPLQLGNAKVKYEFVGSDACQKCHIAEWNIHQGTKHASAYGALVAATKPAGRQFDGECIVCHTVGFKYNTGFMDPKTPPQKAAALNALLKNNGCENCHGPGSNHVATAPLPGTPFAGPAEATFAKEMSPWKFAGQEHLPTVDQLLNNAKLTPGESRILFRADQICQQCHTTETDPHFQFEKAWPKIAHGNKQKPALPAVPAVPVNNKPATKNGFQPIPVPKNEEKVPTEPASDPGPVLVPRKE